MAARGTIGVVTQPAIPDPPPKDQLRAADTDRHAVVQRLQQAHSDGRLDLTEFDDRVRSAYAARTYADLAPLTADLPVPRPVTPPAPPRPPVPVRPRTNVGRLVFRIVGSAWFFASFVNLMIWAIVCIATASWVYPWWVWVAGPWGAVLFAGWLTGFGRRR